jgi:iron complex outermembrane recepter protein
MAFIRSPKTFGRKYAFLLSAAFLATSLTAMPAAAQDADADADAAAQEATEEVDDGEIVITATRRSEALSDVALAVSAVTAETLQNSGASDIRQLNQVSPSLLVSSTSSEAAGGGARIRGIGTVGDNPGLESSVATFIDGVYRSRAGVGLSELGAIDRIEVLRGPQGTLFGRNASAGLLSIITAKPKFEMGGTAEATVGNRGTLRFVGGVTGPLSETIAARVDGVYYKRDGFLRDSVSGRKVNGRDRYLVRGQALFQPNDDLSFRLIADYASRDEECCAASYLPSPNISRDASGNLVTTANPLVTAMRALGAQINDDTYARRVSITPGFDYRSDVKDWGISGELNYDFGGATLTSITAYRDWKVVRGQDADFNNLDILHRASDGNYDQTFKTFTQELRLQGEAFGGRLDWLVGGYYANEKLGLSDNFQYGADYERFTNCALAASIAAGVNVASLVSASGLGCMSQPVANAVSLNPAVPAATAGAIRLFSGLTIPGLGGYRAVAAAIGQPALTVNGTALNDDYDQTSRNFAIFTHNKIDIIEDKLSLTLGLRYTNEKKTLDATFQDNAAFCGAIRTSALAGLAGFPCVINRLPGGSFSQQNAVKKEDKVTGTAVVSFKPIDQLLTYASFSRGYKAGGFNLDRASLVSATPNLQQLTFEPELVDSYELGAKFNGRGIDVNLAIFKQDFKGFQLNAFNGLNFVVTNINSCSTDLANADEDFSGATGACPAGSSLKPGVVSKGVELEAFLRPARNLGINFGLTYTDTSYQDDIVASGGAALGAASYQLPNRRLSNSSAYVTTGALNWTPELGDSGLSGLLYIDYRLQSDTNTGSDLDREKTQDAFIVFNYRTGIRGPDNAWAIEFWAQNLFNKNFLQVAFDAPLQGGGTTRSIQRGFASNSNQLYAGFLGEPRTFGITGRVKF